MFNVNNSFYKFFTELQNKLQAEFDLQPLDEHACLIFAEGVPLSIVYYRCLPSKRIPVTCDKRCIHVDEDTWVTKPDLLLSRIAALAGHARRIHARETVLARIDKPVAMAFQQEHHLQVALPGKYRYGLFHEGELVAVAIFSGGRRMNDKPEAYRSYELLRFCHKQGIQVVGGFSKLLDGFQQDVNPGDIMTYADKDWSDGSSYRQTGFIIVGETEPQLFWVDPVTKKRYHNSTLLVEASDEASQDVDELGYVPIYNSGSIKLVKPIL